MDAARAEAELEKLLQIAERWAPKEQRDKAAAKVIKRFSGVRDPAVMALIAERLGDERIDEYALGALAASIGRMRFEPRSMSGFADLVDGLAELGPGAAEEVLERVFTGATLWDRTCVCQALGRFGTARSVEFLTRQLSDGDAHIRQAAAHGLAAVEDGKALAAGRAELVRVRRQGAEYFRPSHPGYQRDSDQVEWEDESIRLAFSAVEAALDRTSRQDEVDRLRAQRDVDGFITALRDKDGWVRDAAATALGELGDERTVAALAAALHDDWDPTMVQTLRGPVRDDQDAQGYSPVRDHAAEALGLIGGKSAVEALVQARHVYVQGRDVISEALGVIGGPDVVARVADLLVDRDDPQGQRWAAGVLGNLGDPDAVEHLISALEDPVSAEAWVLRAFADALGRLGDERAVPSLVKRLKDDPLKGGSFEAALESIGGPEAQRVLAEYRARYGLTEARHAVEGWSRCYRSGFRSGQDKAERELVEMGAAAIPALTELVSSQDGQDPAVRWMVADVLGRIGDQAAVATLEVLCRDDDEFVRDAAQAATERVRSS